MNLLVRPRILTLLAVGLCLGACTGCRLFVDGFAGWNTPAADERMTIAAKPLAVDLWKPNSSWSPLNELSEVPISDADISLKRWSHSQLKQALKAAAFEGLISAEVRREAEDPQRAAPVDQALNDFFSGVAKLDGLRGWNAAIIWAHYDARAARAAIHVLSRLVLNPPQYAPEHQLSEELKRSGAKSTDPDKSQGTAKADHDPKPALVDISPNMRLAAAEAWCLVLETSHDDAETALAPAGRALQEKMLPARVAEELMRGIARRVRPDRIPGLVPALENDSRKSPAAIEARQAAADACIIHAAQRRIRGDAAPADSTVAPSVGGDDAEVLAAGVEEDAPWPKAFWRFRNDGDPKLRKRLGELAAVIRHPAAMLVLKGQLNDVDLHVREAAVLLFGLLGTDAAWSELGAQAKRLEERPRELAVRGLACQGPAALARFTTDKSAKVRSEAARSVRRRPGTAAARVLRDLLTDTNLDVQLACVQAIRDWPENLATPLLLEALAGSLFKARQLALRQLEDRRGGGLAFPLLAGPQERALRVQQWTRDWNIPDAAVERINELTQKGSPVLDLARLADFREKLQSVGAPGATDAAMRISDWGGQLTPADLPLVEQLLDGATPVETDVLLHQVLPRLSPAYGALVQLESADAVVRRAGASQLGRLGRESSLSPAVCRRMHDLMKSEQDGLVWRLAMTGVFQDGSEEAARLALLAINHHWPDVRSLGCEYVGQHGHSEHAVWLLPVFYDSNKAVQLAAVTAAGKCRNPILLDGVLPARDLMGQRGLRPLLTESQGPLKFAVVVSMSRLGDPTAMEELARLALDANSTSRLGVVQTMGDTGQTRFVEPLIRLAWTEPNHHVRQAALASLQKLVPQSEQPQALIRTRNVLEAVEIWATWWQDRQRKLRS